MCVFIAVNWSLCHFTKKWVKIAVKAETNWLLATHKFNYDVSLANSNVS